MALIDELRAPAPNRALATELAQLAEQITGRLDRGLWAETLIEKVQRLTGREDFDEPFFRALPGVSGNEDFGRLAALGPPKALDQIDGAHVEALIELAATDHANSDYYLGSLERALPYSQMSDLIFWGDRERTYREMAEEALRRHAAGPIVTPPP